jgi:hypothetical protein
LCRGQKFETQDLANRIAAHSFISFACILRIDAAIVVRC